MTDKKGLTIWEHNLETNELKPAVYSNGSIFCSVHGDQSETVETYILEQNENCHYFRALNFKNAQRKIGIK